MVWAASTEIYIEESEVHTSLDTFEKAMYDNDPRIAPYFNPATGDVTFTTTQLKSEINVRGVALAQVGVALAREVTVMQRTFSIGLTPKIINVKMLIVY